MDERDYKALNNELQKEVVNCGSCCNFEFIDFANDGICNLFSEDNEEINYVKISNCCKAHNKL